jgi:N-dimethylarginine dimethylaminohydrolase
LLFSSNHTTEALYVCADIKIISSLNTLLSDKNLLSIDLQTFLPKIKKQPLHFHTIGKSEVNRFVIVREPTYFSVDTGDNPFMIESIKTWESEAVQKATLAYEDEKINAESLNKEDFIKQYALEYIQKKKQAVALQAIAEHANLVKAYRKHQIPCFTLLPEKGKLSNHQFAHKTDEVFSTDTGQYYFDTKLHFIPGNLANPQRYGEERLAVSQATNHLKATLHYLKHPKTGALLKFEGGDIRQAPGRKLFFVGFGHRNDPNVIEAIRNIFGPDYTIVPIELLQPKYYHVDCCFLPLFDDHALVYEGEYQLDADHKMIMEKSDPFDSTSPEWPVLIPGTATMSNESRRIIRQLYDDQHLILITEKEAASFAANAVAVKVSKNGIEKNVMFFPAGSLEKETLAKIESKIPNAIVEQIKFDTMHYSGGSIRCATQEVPCSVEFINQLKLKTHTADDNGIKHLFLFSKKANHNKQVADENQTPLFRYA